jgi:hypothetical protein
MTTLADICNRALQTFGTRTAVGLAEVGPSGIPVSNEAKQFNLIAFNLRDDLLRLAPWDCGLKTANLTYISSTFGTPENQSPATQLWQPGQPPPPWSYEYQYPVDCLRAISIIPVNQTGFSGSVPITPLITGGASAWWQGPPVRYKVQTDQFYSVTSVAIVSGGTGYSVGDIITLPVGPVTSPPIGAPAQLVVTTAPGGVISGVSIVNSIIGASSPVGGSYFLPQSGTIPQGTTTGVGTGATFNLGFVPAGAASIGQVTQRVILTNQEFATLNYVAQVTDPNVMDTLFQTAWIKLTGAAMQMALRGDKGISNMLIEEVNKAIQSARAIDGNEGLTINDVTPDWIRARGVSWSDGYMSGPFSGFDWGSAWPTYT